jgi:hypothetical protein
MNTLVIPAKAGIQTGATGFRVEPGMTDFFITLLQRDCLLICLSHALRRNQRLQWPT